MVKKPLLKKSIFQHSKSEVPIHSLNLTNITITDNIRLKRFDKFRLDSLKWYQDPGNMRDIVGTKTCYTIEQIQEMYAWQDKNGCLFYIEYFEDGLYKMIGDVWLAKDDYAIVIDQDFQNRHIGRQVTLFFANFLASYNQKYMVISEVFDWNLASQKMFMALDFTPFERQKNGWSYRRELQMNKKN